MNMNIFKRSKSTVKHPRQQEPTPVSSTSSSSSSRLPLFPQTNIDFQSSQSSIPFSDNMISSSDSFEDSSRRSTGRKISHRDANDLNKLKALQSSHSANASMAKGVATVSRTSSPSTQTTYIAHSDMYTHNDLNTFSFGAAPSTSASSLFPPIDPLSRHRDEGDSDEVGLIPDTTPRPSVVGNHSNRTHTSQSNGLDDWSSSFIPSRVMPMGRSHRPGDQVREPDSDTASTHTFGTSSASASVSSLSRPRGASSRATSRISGRSSETPQTSANDLTSDEEMDGRHPIPPGALESRPRGFRPMEHESSLYLSEEDFEGYNEDFEHDPIENDCFSPETRGAHFNYPTADQQNGRTYIQTERRRSVAMQIPNPPSDRSHMDHRARDNYSRRPSKSLEDLHSFSFAQASGPSTSASRGVDNHPLPPAPTSVPESEGDWRDLRKRSIQRDKDLPPILNPIVTMSPTDESGLTTDALTLGSPSGSGGLDLDISWMQNYGVTGVVGFDMSEMSDIIGAGGHNGHRPSLYSLRKASTASALRRRSTVSSTNIDIMHKNILGVWGSKKYKDQRLMWTFTKENLNRSEDDPTNRNNGGLEKVQERPSISTLFGSRPSTSNGADLSRATSISFFDKSDNKEKEKSVAKEKTSKEPWKGMSLDSEEIWTNGSNGRFKLNRKNAISVEQGKPPQQRLNVTYIRSVYTSNATYRDLADGPAVTIHKHSKAGAFSISRHYRTRTPGPQDTSSSLRNTTPSVGQNPSRDDTAEGGRKRSNMILLAPRRVQKAYTSTNTTRKLESHGLLDENGRASPRDMERMRRDQDRERVRSTTKEKERERERKEKGKERTKDTDRVKKRLVESSGKHSLNREGEMPSNDVMTSATPLPDSSEGSSTGSVANALSSGDSDAFVNTNSASTTPDRNGGTSSVGSVNSVDPRRSILSRETTSSNRTITQNAIPYRKRGVYDDDDSSDEHPKYPMRTPHSETYAALPPSAFEAAHQEHPSHGLFGWGKSRATGRDGRAYLETPYNPPWAVTQPRSNSETRKGIVDDLNMSFQDVGLLPAIGEIKGSSSGAQHKRRHEHKNDHSNVKRSPEKKQTTDIFEEVPSDALYMLLPLWPEETDPSSAKKRPFAPPPIPTQDRQYVLIYYKTPPAAITPQEETGKTKSGEKKRSRENPPPPEHDRSVLLSTFHISARVVSHRDLQGSGVRIPEVGLAVSGPLEDAYMSMPSCLRVDDYVIGFCHSREAGVEFVPEGFEKMGLSRSVASPSPIEPSDDDDSQSMDTISVLTPIGRAVMEMAWLGGMAVTSFNPGL